MLFKRRKVLAVVGLAALLNIPISSRVEASSSSDRYPTTYRSCPSANTGMSEMGYVLLNGAIGNRTSFHVIPSGIARWASVPDDWTPSELSRCISVWGPAPWNVVSWQGIYDQYDCHDLSPGGIGTGGSWDLEGHRGATRNRWTWTRNTCNW